MRKVPAQTLENALSYYSSNGTKPSVSFTPIVDNKTVFANYTRRILDGKISKTVSAIRDDLPNRTTNPHNSTSP